MVQRNGVEGQEESFEELLEGFDESGEYDEYEEDYREQFRGSNIRQLAISRFKHRLEKDSARNDSPGISANPNEDLVK